TGTRTRSATQRRSSLSEIDESVETEQGRALFRELQWVHAMIRRDLRYCRFVHSHHGAEDVLLFPARG
ncbi:MAG TPA: hypothetical protein VIM03_12810, partial [Thermoleophilaceae bacterium]